jgi:hypothetical protein
MSRLLVAISAALVLCAALSVASAQSAAPASCKVLDAELSQGAYTGGCVNGLAEGLGAVAPRLAGGSSYKGGFLQGKKHGTGVLSHANGDTYSGGWVADQREGYGIYIYGPNSPWFNDRYEGNWLANRMHGVGSYTWSFGDKYEGNWANGVQTDQTTPAQQQRARYVKAFLPQLVASQTQVCSNSVGSVARSLNARGKVVNLADDRILIRLAQVSGDEPPSAPRWDSVSFWVPCK